MEAGNWIALGAVGVTSVGSWFTYKTAQRSVESQRALSDREAAAAMLDETVLQLAEVGKTLTRTDEAFGSGEEDSLHAALEAFSDLDAAHERMEFQNQRLSIRFRSDRGKVSGLAEAFQFAESVIAQLLENPQVRKYRAIRPRNSIDLGDVRDERRAKLDETRNPVGELLDKQVERFDYAQDLFRRSAYRVVGIGIEPDREWTLKERSELRAEAIRDRLSGRSDGR